MVVRVRCNCCACPLPSPHPPPCSGSLSEEKRRLENRLSTIEEDLEEEQMNSETAQEKARKAMQQADASTNEVSQLQASVQKAEANKSQLEKQVCRWGGEPCQIFSSFCTHNSSLEGAEVYSIMLLSRCPFR